jgi:hypothetical protein
VDLTPTAGARYLLERESDGHYRGRIFTPDATFEYALDLGQGSHEVRGTSAPAALEEMLLRFGKLLARSAPPWPERVTRWRR